MSAEVLTDEEKSKVHSEIVKVKDLMAATTDDAFLALSASIVLSQEIYSTKDGFGAWLLLTMALAAEHNYWSEEEIAAGASIFIRTLLPYTYTNKPAKNTSCRKTGVS